jgi:lysophospholipase L1-like esterase
VIRRVAAVLAVLLVVALAPPVSPAAARDEAIQVSIMVVGDSISLGCDSQPLGGWCARLSALLTERGITHHIAGHVASGWSCGALAAGFAARFDAIQPDVVILNCGTNDAPSSQGARDFMGERWRTMVEYSWIHGAHILPVWVQYSNREINAKNGRAWLLSGEGAANDVVYVNMAYYSGAGWFAGIADLQRVPGDWNYLSGGADGMHPNSFGQNVYASIFYRALMGHFGWPDDVPEPCGMWGHREIYDPPNYVPCEVMS